MLAIIFLFISGTTALIYQTLWVKQLTWVVGVDVYVVTTVVAAFFAGLALGAAWLGHRADHTRRPLALYAFLEGGIALLGVGTTLAIPHLPLVFVSLRETFGPLAWGLPFLLVGLPAFFMGAPCLFWCEVLGPMTRE